MEAILQTVADTLDESGRFDNVSYDGDDMIILSEDGRMFTLTAKELTEEEDDV